MHPQLVSVIIPLWNDGKFAKRAIESVLNQTYEHTEIIVIDNGSTDGSDDLVEELLKAHPEKNSQFIRQKTQGLHYAINSGLNLARGDYLTVLKGKEFYHIDRLKKCLEVLTFQNAECCFTKVVNLDENNHFIPPSDIRRAWYSKCLSEENYGLSLSSLLLHDNLAISSGNVIFSRRLYERVGEFKDYKLARDWDYILRIAPFCEPVFVKENLFYCPLFEKDNSTETSSLWEKEVSEIYRNYFSNAVGKPENPYFPSLSNWSYSFMRHLDLLSPVGRSFFVRPDEISPNLTNHITFGKNYQKISSLTNGKRFSLISHELTCSGAPRILIDIAIHLQKSGYRPHIFSMLGGGFKNEVTANAIPVQIFLKVPQFKASMGKKAKLSFLLSILRNAPKVRGTVLCNTTATFMVMVVYSIIMPWKNFIWYIHESAPPSAIFLRNHLICKIARRIVPRLLKKGKLRLWFGSKSTADIWAEENMPGKVLYWSGLQKNENVKGILPFTRIVTAGTVDPRKGTHYLVDAFIYCLQNNFIPKTTKCTIVGFPDYYNDFNMDIIVKILRSAFRSNFEMVRIAEQYELDAILDVSDIYIQTSVMECMPIAIMAAMSRAMPIITTDVNGCIEAIPDNTFGWIVPARNIEKIAASLKEIFKNPADARKRGKKGQGRFNEYFAQEVTADILLREISGTSTTPPHAVGI